MKPTSTIKVHAPATLTVKLSTPPTTPSTSGKPVSSANGFAIL
jgi:hypothetical protein